MTFIPPEASSFSPTVDLILKTLLIISTILTAIVWGLVILFCTKYKRGSTASRDSAPTKSSGLEIVLSGLILVFGLSIFIWSAQVYYHMYSPPQNALEIDVIAKQWMWVFHDSHGEDQINSFKIPLGKPVRLLMTSEDVIHSFFIPAFRIKQDILPGRYTSVWFIATQLGKFDVLCSQYCGLSHSQMRASVEVLTPEAYKAYLYESSPSLTSKKGAEFYAKSGCISCHEGAHPLGPSLQGLYGSTVTLSNGSTIIADENYLRRAILDPGFEVVQGYPSVMPTFQGQFSEAQLMNIINYLKTKK